MATIPRTYNNGDLLTPAGMNAAGNALSGMQITDDNGGFPILGNSFVPGLSLMLGSIANQQAKGFAGAGTFTVPASTWYIIDNWNHASGVSDTVTPSGGAAFAVANAAVQVVSAPWLFLGPGDSITLGAGSFVGGTLIAAPAGVTRILQTVSNTVTLTVPAPRAILLTAAIGPASLINVSIDGVNSFAVTGLDGQGATTNVFKPVCLKANQVVASATASLALLSGIQFTTAV